MPFTSNLVLLIFILSRNYTKEKLSNRNKTQQEKLSHDEKKKLKINYLNFTKKI